MLVLLAGEPEFTVVGSVTLFKGGGMNLSVERSPVVIISAWSPLTYRMSICKMSTYRPVILAEESVLRRYLAYPSSIIY